MVFFIVQVRIKEHWLACTFLYSVSHGGLFSVYAHVPHVSLGIVCFVFSVVYLVATIQNKSPSERQTLSNILREKVQM